MRDINEMVRGEIYHAEMNRGYARHQIALAARRARFWARKYQHVVAIKQIVTNAFEDVFGYGY